MTLDQFVNQNINLVKSAKLIEKVLDALGAFKGHVNKKFNLSKLAQVLKMNPYELDAIVSLILNFQEKFETTFMDHRLIKKKEDGRVYFFLEERKHKSSLIAVKEKIIENKGPIELQLPKESKEVIGSIVDYFEKGRKGKGFDLTNDTFKLIKDIKALYEQYPVLFFKNGGNLVYPSEICSKIGNLILTYDKSNKKLDTIEIDNYKIIF